jgi:hypothetical protein
MAQRESRPLWRVAVDSADRVLGPASEQLVRTEAFADVMGLMSRMRYLSVKRVERLLRRQWHLWNLPAATDVRRLSEQVGSLERQVRDLTRELEDRSPPARANRANGSASAAAADRPTSSRTPKGSPPVERPGGSRA